MKQHITIEQYEELSDDAKLKLIDWVSKKTKVTDSITTVYQDMNIGQMIEFLDEENRLGLPNQAGNAIVWPVDKELCDMLWEVVKEVLTKNE